MGLQLAGIASAHPPEISQRAVGPEGAAVAHFIKAGDAHPIFIGLNVLGPDVQRHLGQIEISSNPGSGGDASGAHHVQNHLHRQVIG